MHHGGNSSELRVVWLASVPELRLVRVFCWGLARGGYSSITLLSHLGDSSSFTVRYWRAVLPFIARYTCRTAVDTLSRTRESQS